MNYGGIWQVFFDKLLKKMAFTLSILVYKEQFCKMEFHVGSKFYFYN